MLSFRSLAVAILFISVSASVNAASPTCNPRRPKSVVSSSLVLSTTSSTTSTATPTPSTTSTSTRATLTTIRTTSTPKTTAQPTTSTPKPTTSTKGNAFAAAAQPTTASKPSSGSSSGSSSSSSGSSPAPAAAGGSVSAADIQQYLDIHNTERAKFGAGTMTWNNTLEAAAQKWANNCVFQHSGGSLGPFGENLSAGTGSFDIPAGMQGWIDEQPQYSSSNPQPSHWTQMVWKNSVELGCAVATCDNIFDFSKFGASKFYVCEYFPQGNIIGQFAQNVQ
ncbi:unnamed protein product [Mycena citricolor]|uniref:SCP domain-containing protein n=1 Tax=Mycena citricolor TaxID=2018698 RepID=A0AAD2H0J6_9AGAR|nr:unnamed protein product [Mycena citricolor]